MTSQSRASATRTAEAISGRATKRYLNGSAALALFLALSASAGSARALDESEYPLGKVDFTTSCTDATKQELNQAVALLHHMTYPRAKAAFEWAAELDPECAMAHWGIAMSLFQPLWPTRPGPNQLREGWQAVQKAKALAPAERARAALHRRRRSVLPRTRDYRLLGEGDGGAPPTLSR